MELLTLQLFLIVLLIGLGSSDFLDDQCVGYYYKNVSSAYEEFKIAVDTSRQVRKLVSRSCFSSLTKYSSEVHIKYNISTSGPLTGIISAVTYGPSDLSVSREYLVNVNSNGDDNRKEYIFFLKNVADSGNIMVEYSVSEWTVHNGLVLQLYFQPYMDMMGCSSWQLCNSYNADPNFQICMPMEWKCDGIRQCVGGDDEADCPGCCKFANEVSLCSDSNNCVCENHQTNNLQKYNDCNGASNIYYQSPTNFSNSLSGSFFPPSWPLIIPSNYTYVWSPYPSGSYNLSLTFTRMLLSAHDVIRVINGDNVYTLTKKSPGSTFTLQLLNGDVPRIEILMTSPFSDFFITYNFLRTEITSRGAFPCDDLYIRSCRYKDLCFMPSQLCNDYMDCPNGHDELGCAYTKKYNFACSKEEIICPGDISKPQCFTLAQRCDGNNQCSSKYDELKCDSSMCGPHNGTYLCTDGECIFETWLCDKQKDCSDGADEVQCEGTSRQVITASVMGSLVCAMMIVIAAGCSCKLHAHRLYESMHNSSRYESPMTLIQNQLMRRTAPPPYAEAMQRSRPFEEVQNEYLAALEQQRSNLQHTADEEAEQQSVASSSAVGDNGLLVEVTVDPLAQDTNKPLEEQAYGSNPANVSSELLEPKPDDVVMENGHTGSNPAGNGDNRTQSRRQVLRRTSTDSDASLLSHDSDDAALIP